MDTEALGQFDLESYICCYSGFTKIQRLKFIAEQACGHRLEQLELDALTLAANELRTRSDNVKHYQIIMEMINGRLGPNYVCDSSWIELVRFANPVATGAPMVPISPFVPTSGKSFRIFKPIICCFK